MKNGQYIAVNEAACALTGYSRKALTGFRAGELAADEPSRRIYENVMQGRKLRGRKFNVSRERVRQIENQSLKKLRSLAESQKLGDVA
jgi:PAS domain S-box-containing protein